VPFSLAFTARSRPSDALLRTGGVTGPEQCEILSPMGDASCDVGSTGRPTRTVLYPPASSPEKRAAAFGVLRLLSVRIVLLWLIKAALLAVAFAFAPPLAVYAGMAAWAVWHAIPRVLPPPPQPQSGDPRAQALQLRATTYARAAGVADHAHVSLDGPEKAQLMTVTHRRRRTLAVIVPRNSPVLDFPIAAQDAELHRRIALLGRPWRAWTVVWLSRIVPTGVLIAYLLLLPAWARALCAGPIAGAVLLGGTVLLIRAPLTRALRDPQRCPSCGAKGLVALVVATAPGADRRDPYVRCAKCRKHYETLDGALVEFLPAP